MQSLYLHICICALHLFHGEYWIIAKEYCTLVQLRTNWYECVFGLLFNWSQRQFGEVAKVLGRDLMFFLFKCDLKNCGVET